MKNGNGFDRLLLGVKLPGEIPPGWPLIEIVGNKRILIENQLGVCGYDRCNIVVKVRQGKISISGENLELCQMTKEQLVITGVIFSVSLEDWR